MNLKAFLKENVSEALTKKEVHLKRFSEPFVIKMLSPEELRRVQSSIIENVKSGKPKVNTDRFYENMVLACVLEPDLLNAELQDSWGVTSPGALLDAMLTGAEYAELSRQVNEFNRVDTSFEQDKETVKN